MGTRQHRLLIARIALTLLLFAQGVMAGSACDWIENSPDRAVLAAAEVAPCHDSGFGAACLTHCLSDRQATQKITLDVPAMPLTPVLPLSPVFDAAATAGFAPLPETAFSTGPPRRILLQSFQV